MDEYVQQEIPCKNDTDLSEGSVRELWFILLIMAAIFTVVTIPCFYLMRVECEAQLSCMHVDGYFLVFGGCFAQAEGGSYIPLKYYRGLEGVQLKRKP